MSLLHLLLYVGYSYSRCLPVSSLVYQAARLWYIDVNSKKALIAYVWSKYATYYQEAAFASLPHPNITQYQYHHHPTPGP